MTRFRLPAVALATSALIGATPATATPQTLWEVLTVDYFSNLMGVYVITLSRTVADVTYGDMDISLLEPRMAISGLTVRPYESPGDGDCAITADRAVLTGSPIDQFDDTWMTVDLLGLEVSEGCFYASDLQGLSMVGIERLALDRAQIRLETTLATGAISLDFQAVTTGMAELRGAVDFSYFAMNILENPPEPVLHLAGAELEITDLGAWAGLAPMMPGFITDADTMRALFREELLDGPQFEDSAPTTAPILTPPGPTTPTTPPPGTGSKQATDPDLAAAEAFIDEMAEAIAAFAADPGRIALTLAPESPVVLDEDALEGMDDSFAFTVALLSPSIMSGPVSAPVRVTPGDAETIAAWLRGDAIEIAREDHLRFARAFITGIGAPRDIATGLELLTPLLEDQDSAAIALALDHIDALDPQHAYRLAHHAAGGGDRAAFALLDRLERALPVAGMLQVQNDASARPTLTGEESPADLRAQGLAALTGLGEPRSYARAYYFGLLALAEGDRAAEAIIDEIEAMATRLDDEEGEAWAGVMQDVRDAAQDLFFARGQATEE